MMQTEKGKFQVVHGIVLQDMPSRSFHINGSIERNRAFSEVSLEDVKGGDDVISGQLMTRA